MPIAGGMLLPESASHYVSPVTGMRRFIDRLSGQHETWLLHEYIRTSREFSRREPCRDSLTHSTFPLETKPRRDETVFLFLPPRHCLIVQYMSGIFRPATSFITFYPCLSKCVNYYERIITFRISTFTIYTIYTSR